MLFVRLADPNQHTEAITSRPLLLYGVGRQTRHANQTTITITSTHGKAGHVRQMPAEVVTQLHTWGAWEWEEQLIRETLAWMREGSREAAVLLHALGLLAEARGDYEGALDWTRKSLAIKEQIGDRAMALTVSQSGILYTETGRAADAVPLNL